ncbi:hypothetical protein FZI85_14160 [Mycobacterium sp. CBMA293]|uniref:hypothetical protein n=1 Tax=unclassified Mycolicibacterium TaxID=2636767 RepID=UPI0012DCC8C7|nr:MULTISPECIES: hypothetical protein [unclassified Mycolicibacterium]MUL48166.1 hypothetical protein [Mycolicibacterium sp. CBMA 360]MUL57665.1 hypothetical protein [Mycolicibacterium sp. CBMA 335]MUL70705.1 hypothetical protein [Mycolicibacterium sp. CBMA 311]MUL92753.1 hypothetical protein [Mycolicibacterium sp. CBMA 230]MUM08231.1 hypothetical protein [Mycolicibacterium sp. CBMA 213]
MTAGWEQVRAVADAVLYEGYLLYPYRATSGKNQSRWQFGVLGPQQATELGLGEADTLSAQLLVSPGPDMALTIVVRFLQLQHRAVQRRIDGRFEPVDELSVAARTWLAWDEAVEYEVSLGPFSESELATPQTLPIVVAGGTDIEHVDGGRLIRTRAELHAELTVRSEPDDGLLSISLEVRNIDAPPADKDIAIARSLIGTHLITEVSGGEFVSLLEPPESAADAVSRCLQYRCFPVLAGPPGSTTLMLISPIILYDHPQIAEQSKGALFDSTEIDEILTLRVMTMTDEEKAQARATDPRAAEIIDRCDAMSPEALLNLHGVLRNPHSGTETRSLIPEVPEGMDWWDPLADTAVAPSIDAVLVNGVRVSRDSRVRLHPCRRADAQDLFYADKVARVTCVHETVDGDQQIGVVLEDDPAAEMHDWYGRYLYFAPDEVEPLSEGTSPCK